MWRALVFPPFKRWVKGHARPAFHFLLKSLSYFSIAAPPVLPTTSFLAGSPRSGEDTAAAWTLWKKRPRSVGHSGH